MHAFAHENLFRREKYKAYVSFVVVYVTQSCLTLLVTAWTVARQAPLSMGFPRQNAGVGCHFHLQGIFLTQGLSGRVFRKSPALQADSWTLSHQGSPYVSLWSVKKWVTGLIDNQIKMSSFWTHVDPGHQAVGLTWRGPQSSPWASPGQRTFWQRRRLHQPCVYGCQSMWCSVVFYLLS